MTQSFAFTVNRAQVISTRFNSNYIPSFEWLNGLNALRNSYNQITQNALILNNERNQCCKQAINVALIRFKIKLPNEKKTTKSVFEN